MAHGSVVTDESYRQPGNPEIGAKIRSARQLAGLTLTEAARLAGCTKGHLSMVETGSRAPSRALAAKLAELLAFNAAEAREVRDSGVKPKPYVPKRSRGRQMPTIISGYRPRVPFHGSSRGPLRPPW
jgi:transcriptional regulator with XRE-family HTH domain